MSNKNAFAPQILSNRASFLIAGFGLAAWGPMIPYIRERFNLNEQTLGLVLLCVGIGGLCSMPISTYLVGKIGCKKVIYTSSIIMAICLIAISFINVLALLVPVLVIYGMGTTTTDVVSNVNAAAIEKRSGLIIMSGLHGLFSVGGFLGAVCMTFILTMQVPLQISAILASTLLLISLYFFCKNLIGTVQEESDNKDNTAKRKFYIPPIILLVSVMCFIMFLTEGSMLDWSSVYLHSNLNMPIEISGYGYATFAIAMTIFRLTGDKIVTTLGRRKTLVLGCIIIVIGYIVCTTSSNFYQALLGFFFIGVGASNVVPQLVSFAATCDEIPMHLSVAYINAVGFAGILTGPAIIGFVADHIGLEKTFICISGFVLIVGILATVVLKKKKPS